MTNTEVSISDIVECFYRRLQNVKMGRRNLMSVANTCTYMCIYTLADPVDRTVRVFSDLSLDCVRQGRN